MKHGTLWFVFTLLGLLAASLPARGSINTARHELIYDAQEECFRQKLPGQNTPSACKEVLDPYAADVLVEVRVSNAFCGRSFRFEVDERALGDADSGFRGLEDAKGLITSVGVAEAKSGELGFRGDIDDRSLGKILEMLVTQAGAQELARELEAEILGLSRRLGELSADVEAFSKFANRVASGPAGSVSPQTWGSCEQLPAGTIFRYRCRTVELAREISNARTCEELDGEARKIRDLQVQVNGLRRWIESSDEAKLPPSLKSDLGAFRSRLDTFGFKLERVEVGIGLTEKVLPAFRSGRESSETFLAHLRRLTTTYQDLQGVSASTLQNLARTYRDIDLRGKEGLEDAFGKLRTVLAEARRELQGLEGGLEDRREALKETKARFDQSVEGLSRDLRDAYLVLQTKYEAGRLTYDRTVRAIGPWSQNQALTLTVSERVDFKLPDLSSLVETTIPAEKIVAEEGEEEAPPPDDGFREVATAAVEVHKVYRFNVGAGPLVSWIDKTDYAVRSRPQLDATGQVVTGDDGQALTEVTLEESGREDRQVSSALFVTYYIRKWGLLDLFPGEEAFKPIWGIAFGFGLKKPEENLFAGLSYQPTLGVQIIAGAHYGKTSVPENGIDIGSVLPSGTTEPPIRDTSKLAPFLGVVFDAAVFKRLLRGSS